MQAGERIVNPRTMVKTKKKGSLGRPNEVRNNQTASKRGNGRRTRKPAKRASVARAVRLSDAGRAFLKCAFAPPDFNVDPGKGIPDQYAGKTLTRKDVLTSSLSGTAGRDDYYIIAPTPGVAFWFASTNPGVAPTAATVWQAFSFPSAFGSGSLFGDEASGGSLRATNVDAFRYASLCAGIYPTSNLMMYSGSIQVWKAPLKQTFENDFLSIPTSPPTTINVSELTVAGLESASSVPTENYSHSFIDGMYTVAGNNQPDFPFKPILEAYSRVPSNTTGASMFGVLNGPYLGLGDTDATIVKVATPAGAVNSFVLKVWACTEFKVNTSSPFYQYAGTSPHHDPLALELYRRCLSELPLAVVCAENAKFWESVLRILRGLSSAASYVPGPIGMIGKGVGMVTDGISALAM